MRYAGQGVRIIGEVRSVRQPHRTAIHWLLVPALMRLLGRPQLVGPGPAAQAHRWIGLTES